MRNTVLYNKLGALFGKVQVANEGTEQEEYRVCCPFCGDTRNRLYINCRWGTTDPAEQRTIKHLVNCYNEKCVQTSVGQDSLDVMALMNRTELFSMVWGSVAGIARVTAATKESNTGDGPIDWPGQVVRLDRLMEAKPDHPAVVYMQSRGFDVRMLGEEHGFVF